MMDRETARATAKARLGEYLSRIGVDTDRAARGNTTCPLCGHNGCFSYQPSKDHWRCFSCNTGGDIFDLYAAVNGIGSGGSSGEAFNGVYSELGIDIERGEKHDGSERNMSIHTSAAAEHTHTHTTTVGTFTDYYRACSDRLGGVADTYLSGRGFSRELCERFGIGFDPEWHSPKAVREGRRSPASPRVIIPVSDRYYLARDIRPKESVKGTYIKCMNATTGEGVPLSPFNAAAIVEPVDPSVPVYVVEGWANALSIIACGGSAVAIGSVSYARQFVTGYAERCKAQGLRLVLSLDNDGAGARAIEELAAGLTAAGVDFIRDQPQGEHKDANESYVAERAAFSARLITSFKAYEARRMAAVEQGAEAYRDRRSTAAHAAAFLGEISSERELTPSGYRRLDHAVSGWADGGLPNGLYVIGAISSLGKTTYILQMADQMAAAGRDVMIFSLEMSRAELIGKSLSRQSFLKAMEGDGTRARFGCSFFCRSEGVDDSEIAQRCRTYGAYSWSDIRDLRLKQAKGWLDINDEARIKQEADTYFKGTGRRVFIEEGAMGGTSMEDIRRRVEEHKRETGKAPVVFIDYLQMVAAPEGMQTANDKTITDRKILACKVMSRDYRIPVFVISSLNRASYYKPMSLEAFKESGSIEYSADVVLGLQYPRMEDVTANGSDKEGARIEQEEKSKAIREVEVKILKNRTGSMIDKPRYDFIPRFNLFIEQQAAVLPTR